MRLGLFNIEYYRPSKETRGEFAFFSSSEVEELGLVLWGLAIKIMCYVVLTLTVEFSQTLGSKNDTVFENRQDVITRTRGLVSPAGRY